MSSQPPTWLLRSLALSPEGPEREPAVATPEVPQRRDGAHLGALAAGGKQV
jgi:hypothetical protein